MKTILLLSLLSTPSAYINVLLNGAARSSDTLLVRTRLNERIDGSEFGDSIGNNDDDDDSTSSFTQSLSERIAQVEQNESSFVAGLQKRVKSVTSAEEFDSAMSSYVTGENNSTVVELPVVCFDALLPNQRLTGSTTDPTFCNLLRSIGLGGTFVMTSLNNRQRKVRRFGVVAKIELGCRWRR
mmetsp:Transcript_10221/g.22722  ORF Transcript_10221/g.22722 Transcript_10221/m.22722 type:complete len:183 (-) Transcript_10221:2157-2705(-)